MAEASSLAKKLAHVMKKVQYIQKRGKNKFHGYTYATEADVNDAVREYLAEQNVIMMPSVEGHTMRETTTRSGNTEYIACVNMTFTFLDGDTGEQFTIKMSGEGQDVGDKAMYKAISGTQKYALMKAFMIPTGDDPESDEGVDKRNHGQPSQPEQTTRQTQQKPPQTAQNGSLATPKQISLLHRKAKEKGLTSETYPKWLHAQVGKTDEQLTKKEASELIDAIGHYTPQTKEAHNNGFGTEDPFASDGEPVEFDESQLPF